TSFGSWDMEDVSSHAVAVEKPIVQQLLTAGGASWQGWARSIIPQLAELNVRLDGFKDRTLACPCPCQ
ncbi:hypothetical protein, partial [Klebsiella pneumoniae]|uniref:hypothetical protein n=1 Tax=Klebsiella pneumoniae TaxID=573 RepID=UPI002730DE23